MIVVDEKGGSSRNSVRFKAHLADILFYWHFGWFLIDVCWEDNTSIVLFEDIGDKLASWIGQSYEYDSKYLGIWSYLCVSYLGSFTIHLWYILIFLIKSSYQCCFWRTFVILFWIELYSILEVIWWSLSLLFFL